MQSDSVRVGAKYVLSRAEAKTPCSERSSRRWFIWFTKRCCPIVLTFRFIRSRRVEVTSLNIGPMAQISASKVRVMRPEAHEETR